MNHDIITISREFGSEGHEIGKKLSMELGIPLYDKDILAIAAKELHVPIGLLAPKDEVKINDKLGTFFCFHDEIPNDQLFYTESRLIKQFAEEGPCIIVGRLADYILKDQQHCLKVLITAPLEKRVDIISKKRNISNSKAKKLIHKMDSARNSYYSFYSDGQWNHEAGKDIMISRQIFDIDACVAIIKKAYQLMKIGNED